MALLASPLAQQRGQMSGEVKREEIKRRLMRRGGAMGCDGGGGRVKWEEQCAGGQTRRLFDGNKRSSCLRAGCVTRRGKP